jgi:hypothetical protein
MATLYSSHRLGAPVCHVPGLRKTEDEDSEPVYVTGSWSRRQLKAKYRCLLYVMENPLTKQEVIDDV